MMHKIAVLALFGLAGCAARPAPTPYGNFAAAPVEFDERLAADVVKQLVALYPPASTRLEFRQSTPDAFGTRLVNALRDKGYALAESNLEDAAQQTKPGGSTSGERAAVAQQPAGLELRYVLDQEAGLYRVTVTVGSQSLTRAYVEQNNTVLPAGSWVRKE